MKPNWALVEQMARNADAIHWDGCHKIYLSMDASETLVMQTLGYEIVEPDLETLKDWYNRSCGLRFIQAIFTTNSDNPCDAYVVLVPQFVQEI